MCGEAHTHRHRGREREREKVTKNEKGGVRGSKRERKSFWEKVIDRKEKMLTEGKMKEKWRERK